MSSLRVCGVRVALAVALLCGGAITGVGQPAQADVPPKATADKDPKEPHYKEPREPKEPKTKEPKYKEPRFPDPPDTGKDTKEPNRREGK